MLIYSELFWKSEDEIHRTGAQTFSRNNERTSAFLKVNFKSLFCSLFFGEHQGEVQCSDGFCEAWPVLCLFRPAFSESEEEELQDAGLPGNWWQRSNQSFTFFLTVCLVWICVFFNLYPFLEIFFISKLLFCQIEGFLFDIHTDLDKQQSGCASSIVLLPVCVLTCAYWAELSSRSSSLPTV